MSAKDMFEELGYKLYLKTDTEICYMEEKNKWYISFYLDDKVFQCCENDFYTTSCCVTLKELQAINKQVEELGWK